MNIDEQHVALPKLYGAPAYARPPRVYDPQDRPIDPDDLPIEAFRTEEDRELLAEMRSADRMTATARDRGRSDDGDGDGSAAARSFSRHALGRIVSGGR